ncbi:MAG: Hsp20/alpha crystallin family protein [bacterium]
MTTNNDVTVKQQQSTSLMKTPSPVATVMPLADIYETPDAFVLMLDMPGASKEAISITMDESSLVIKADVESYAQEDAKLLFSEIAGVGYQRVFNISDGIDRNSVDAKYDNGVLTVKLFKKEKLKPREIRVQ